MIRSTGCAPDVVCFLLLTVISALSLLSPWALGREVEAQPDVQAAGYEFSRYAEAFAIGVAFPIIVEAIIDRKLPHTITLPRWAHITSLTVPNIVLFLSPNQTLRLCVSFTREVMFRGFLMSHMFNEKERFTPVQRWLYFFIMIVFCVHAHTTMWSYICGSECLGDNLIYTLLVIACLVAISVVVHFVRKTPAHKVDKHAVVYSILVVVSVVVKGTVKAAVYGADTFPNNYYTGLIAAWDAILSMFAATIPSRIARNERDLSQYHLTTKKNFIRFLSNEYHLSLKTIITGVEITNSTVQSYCDMPYMAGVQRLLTDVRYSCDMAGRLLDNVMLVDEIKDNALSLIRLEHPVFDIINEAVKPLEQVAAHAQVDLRYSSAEHLDTCLLGAMVNVDKTQFIQALRNLISHAINVTPQGQSVEVFCFARYGSPIKKPPTSSVRIYAVDEESGLERPQEDSSRAIEKVCIEIHDHGPGVPEEVQQDLFKDSMIDNYRSRTITANAEIGLYVAQSIISLHDGRIGVYSEENKGCIFSMEISVSSVRDGGEITSENEIRECCELVQDTPTGMPSLPVEEPTNFLPHERTRYTDVSLDRALIVSSNSNDLRTLYDVLKPCTADIVKVNSYSDALSEIRNSLYEMRPYNVLFLDSMMHMMHDNNALAMMSLFRKKGYTGIAALVSDKNFPDTNEKFPLRGGQHVLLRPLVVNEVKQVLIDAHHMLMKSNINFLPERGLQTLDLSCDDEEKL